MSELKKKKPFQLERDQEVIASKFFGKHVTPVKALVVFIAAVIMAALPMLAGLRLWGSIPEIVQTGILDAQGNDDSMPRAVLVFGLPGLFTVLTIICHGQLWLNQKAQKLPKASIRLLGRWTTAVISLLLCTWAANSAAGIKLTSAVWALLIFAAAICIFGSMLFDCKRKALFSIPFECVKRNDLTWKISHRMVGGGFLLAGIVMLLPIMLSGAPRVWAGIVAPLLIVGSVAAVFPVCAKIPHI